MKLEPGKSDRLEWDKPGRPHTFANLSSFAEQMLVYENAIVNMRDDKPFDRAALIGCGVMTGFGAAVITAKVRPGETVAVIGCGGVGMAAVNGAYIAGAGRIIAVDTNPAKLQAATRLGASDLVNPADGDPVERIIEMTSGGYECIGPKTAAEQAFQMLAVGGAATIVGLIPGGEKVELHGYSLLGERKLQGCSMGSNRFRVDMPRLIELYPQGRLHLDDWISQRIRLEQINGHAWAARHRRGRRRQHLPDPGAVGQRPLDRPHGQTDDAPPAPGLTRVEPSSRSTTCRKPPLLRSGPAITELTRRTSG